MEIEILLNEIDKSELLAENAKNYIKSLVKLAYSTGRVDASKEMADNISNLFKKNEN